MPRDWTEINYNHILIQLWGGVIYNMYVLIYALVNLTLNVALAIKHNLYDNHHQGVPKQENLELHTL